MSASWSPQQREWLQALGHEVLVLAGAEAPSPATSVLASTTPDHPAPTRPAAGDGPLLRALRRAAGRRDLDQLVWLPDPESLRGDAAAKRALWPRLRHLRKPSGDAT